MGGSKIIHLSMLDGSIINGGPLLKAPTVCLLVSDGGYSHVGLSSVIERTTSVGCRYYMTWGKAADILHDVVDEILEQSGDWFEDVVTSSHRSEPPREVAWFYINAALPSESDVQYCISYSKETKKLQKLLNECEGYLNRDSC